MNKKIKQLVFQQCLMLRHQQQKFKIKNKKEETREIKLNMKEMKRNFSLS